MSALTVAMVQSSYIPWKGYFDMVNSADLFVFYDDVQFTKEDWRSRNLVKTKDGPKWLTVPCGSPRGRRICDVELPSSGWQRRHWAVIRNSYSRARGFELYAPFFEERYLRREWRTLSELNQMFIRDIAEQLLGSTTRFADSRDYAVDPRKVREARWIEMLGRIGATHFLIGPSARNYLDPAGEARARDAGIELVWLSYEGYPEYRQMHPPFEQGVSIVDLLMSEGEDATRYMKSFGHDPRPDPDVP